jgi:hypothetical protein
MNPGFEMEVLLWIPAIFTMKSNARQREASQNALRKKISGSQQQDVEFCKRYVMKPISPSLAEIVVKHYRIL